MTIASPSIPGEETGRHLPHLDGWRGVAVLLVLVGHFALDAWWPRTSSLGVELFFVLSGRLMAEILFVRRSPLPTFFFRRFSRIYPGLLCYVALATIVVWKTPLAHGGVAVALALTFTINYAMVLTHEVAVLEHIWSLCVEEHSYIVLALVAFVARRRAFPLVAVLALLAAASITDALVSYYVIGQRGSVIWWRSDVAAAELLLAATFWLWRGQRGVAGWIALPAIIVAAVLRELPWVWLANVVPGVLLAVAVVAVDRAPALRAMLGWRVLRIAGLWSYSLYLWQQLFYQIARFYRILPPLLLPAVFVSAIASFYLVERPARTGLNAWLAQGAAA